MKIMSIQNLVWLVIFHDTEGPITKIEANWEGGGGGGYKKSLSRCSFDKYLKYLSSMHYLKMFNCNLIYAEFYNMG